MTKKWQLWMGIVILVISAACSSQSSQNSAAPKVAADNDSIATFMASAPFKQQRQVTPTPIFQSSLANREGLPLPAVEPLYVEGDFQIAGSVTVTPITRLVYKWFVHDGFSGNITIQEVDTTSGFQIYCEAGESDVAMALRPMLQSELDACLKRGRTPVALQIGKSPIIVAINPANTFALDVTLGQLAQMFTMGSWSDINPNWPAQDIVRYVPNTRFGSFSHFVDLVLKSDAEALQKATFTTLVDDQTSIPQSITENNNALGFMDYPFYVNNARELQLVSIEGIKPNTTTVTSDTYPLVAPLLLYTDEATLQAKPQVAQFLIFYLAHLNEALAEAGEFPISVEQLDRTKVALAEAMGNGNYLNKIRQQLKQKPTNTPTPMVTLTLQPTLQTTLTLTNTPPITNTPAK